MLVGSCVPYQKENKTLSEVGPLTKFSGSSHALVPKSHMLERSIQPLTLSPLVTTFVVCSSHLLVFLGSLNCKQYGPRSDCFLWSSLLRVHIVYVHGLTRWTGVKLFIHTHIFNGRGKIKQQLQLTLYILLLTSTLYIYIHQSTYRIKTYFRNIKLLASWVTFHAFVIC